jgi:hypothetical protein
MSRTRKKVKKHFPQTNEVWKPRHKFRFHVWGKDRWLYVYENEFRAKNGWDDRFVLIWDNSDTPIQNKAYLVEILERLEKISEKPGYWYKTYR